MDDKRNFNRRDFLHLALATGGTIVLSPFLKACGNLQTLTPTITLTPTPTQIEEDLLSGLRGLGIDNFFQEAYRRWLVRDPETLTTLGLADVLGIGDGNLTNISDDYIRQTQALEGGTLDILRTYDRSSFTFPQSLTADIYEWFLDDLVRGHPFMYDEYPVSPIITSVHYNLYALFTIYQPLSNIQDAKDYISRLSQVGVKISQLVDGLRRREQHGVILPAFMIPIVLADIIPIADNSSSSNPFYSSINDRLTGVTTDERKSLLSQAKEEIEVTVTPAYRQLADFLKGQQARASNTVGVWQFEDGEAYYAQSLRRQTTTETTADEIHELGKQHVDRIHTEMRTLFAALGYPSGESIPRLVERLTKDSGSYNGQEAVNAYKDVIQNAETVLPQAFDTLPRTRVTVVGGNEGDFYMPASYDGSRPGLFYARTTGSTPKFGVKTLAYHETIPGHHLQTSFAQEIPNLTYLQQGMQFNAYTEGWALYAERLMWELGVYAGDPQGDLGRLQMEVFRAARLVVDTGVHAKHWSFDQAVDYLVETAGFSVDYAQGEITRYSVWPGQATSYYLGFLKFLELRQKVKDALGDKFDLKAFHRIVLENGSVPLSILEDLIDRYIRGGA